LATYIAPYEIARVRLEDLAADDIVRWLATLRRKKVLKTATGGQLKPIDKKLSNSTIAIAFRRLRKALATAKTHKLISENVVAAVDPPATGAEREHVILEPVQMIAFLAV
jgi:hypothetical protein